MSTGSQLIACRSSLVIQSRVERQICLSFSFHLWVALYHFIYKWPSMGIYVLTLRHLNRIDCSCNSWKFSTKGFSVDRQRYYMDRMFLTCSLLKQLLILDVMVIFLNKNFGLEIYKSQIHDILAVCFHFRIP